MQRYFSDKLNKDIFDLKDDDIYHITKVMRITEGEKVEIVYKNETYISEIIKNNNTIKAKIITKLDEYNELDNEIILVQSLVKEQKMDYILQKSTELGVNKIIPFKASRSIVKENDKEIKKIERWNKITKEASEQSKRNIIPEVTKPVNINELIDLSKNIDIKIICTVNEKSINLKECLKNIENKSIIFVVGPEGGFTNEEESKLIDSGFTSISLGKSVLRTETASLFVLSVIRFINMG